MIHLKGKENFVTIKKSGSFCVLNSNIEGSRKNEEVETYDLRNFSLFCEQLKTLISFRWVLPNAFLCAECYETPFTNFWRSYAILFVYHVTEK